MKRFFCISLVLLLALALTACGGRENPPTEHVLFKGQLYNITERVAEPYQDLDESKLIEAKVVSIDTLPTEEGQVNAAAASAQIYELDDTQFLVIIDGVQYVVHY